MENNLPQRKNLRLRNFDYSSAGAYFVTICTQNREKILSEVIKANATSVNEMFDLESVGDGCERDASAPCFYIEKVL